MPRSNRPATLVRTQILLTHDQYAALKQAGRASRESMSHIIRRLIRVWIQTSRQATPARERER